MCFLNGLAFATVLIPLAAFAAIVLGLTDSILMDSPELHWSLRSLSGRPWASRS